MAQVARENQSFSFEDGNLIIDSKIQKVVVHGEVAFLSKTEHNLLLVLVSNHGCVIPHDRILETVWGPDYGYHELLRLTIMRLRRKIEKDPSQPRYIKNLCGHGNYLDLKS